MVKAAKRARKKGGPYLPASFFCEKIIEDKQDSALSAIRIIDTINVQLDPSTPSEIHSEEHRVPVSIASLLSFKTGDSPGEHTVRIVMQSPSGKESETVFEQVIPFPPEPQGGANLRVQNVIQVKKGGLFWMEVILDGKPVTRMPLLISIQRAETVPFKSTDAEKKPDSRSR
jgi:hypothetical protein